MDDTLALFLAQRPPTPAHPLLGLTVLVVEDSRFACEALRLLCLRSGARIRRADCLKSAHRHLQTYRPSVVIVDLGLPDGSGLGLIRTLAAASPRVPVILGTSGDPAGRGAALACGADGFLDKPVESLSAFQQAILALLPAGLRPQRIAASAGGDRIQPDPIALHDDLVLAADILDRNPDAPALAYVARFLTGVARVAHDAALVQAAEGLADAGRPGDPAGLRQISGLLRDRLDHGVSALPARAASS